MLKLLLTCTFLMFIIRSSLLLVITAITPSTRNEVISTRFSLHTSTSVSSNIDLYSSQDGTGFSGVGGLQLSCYKRKAH